MYKNKGMTFAGECKETYSEKTNSEFVTKILFSPNDNQNWEMVMVLIIDHGNGKHLLSVPKFTANLYFICLSIDFKYT